jgi:hypothetical protein
LTCVSVQNLSLVEAIAVFVDQNRTIGVLLYAEEGDR